MSSFNHNELTRGTHVHCRLYGGMDGYVTEFRPGNEPLARVLDGVGVKGGGIVKIVYTGERLGFSSVPEGIVRGPQWLIGSEPSLNETDLRLLIRRAELSDQNKLLTTQAKKYLSEIHRFTGENIIDLFTRLHSPSKPPQAFVVLNRLVDVSDYQSDYYGSRIETQWLIGESAHARQIFNEMRRSALAASNYLEAQDFFNLSQPLIELSAPNSNFENRENYRGGDGMFLASQRRGNRWIIKKDEIQFNKNRLSRMAGSGQIIIPGEKPKDNALRHAIVDCFESNDLDIEAITFKLVNHMQSLDTKDVNESIRRAVQSWMNKLDHSPDVFKALYQDSPIGQFVFKNIHELEIQDLFNIDNVDNEMDTSDSASPTY